MEAKKSTFSLKNLDIELPPAPASTQQKSTARRPLHISLPHGSDATATTPPIPALTKQDDERVKVFVRIRPTHKNETPNALEAKRDGRSLALRRHGDVHHHHHHTSDFSFDGVLGPEASQADVYDIAAKQAVNDVVRGYNATLMAYGMTGTGKTFTLGSIHPDAVGIIPRALGDIFDFVQSDPAYAYTVTFSYLQIYCEQLQDLLCPDSGDNLPIREGAAGVYVPNLKQIEVTSLEDCLQLLQIGARNRNVAFTALNAHSSRSHAVVIATVIQRPLVTAAGRTAPRVHVGKLYMVDLAGSERLKKSKSTGQRASEAKAINLSLTTLGMCVSARASGTAAHIPFRDSKLTRLLQESLGGNARTSLVVAVADAAEHAEETLQSLQFGSRAMRVVTQAKVNECYEGSQDAQNGGPGSPLMTSRTRTLVESLLEKESELDAVQAQLKASEQQSKEVVEALKQEHEAMAEKAATLAVQHAAQQAEQEMLHRAVLEAEERVACIEAHFHEQKEILEGQVESLKADALRSAKEADAAHWLLESERVAMEERIEEQRPAFELINQEVNAANEASRMEEATKHASELAELREVWEREKAQLSKQHALAVAAALGEETAKLEFAFKEVENLRQQLEAATGELELERQATAEKVQQAEATWAHKRKTIIEKAETRKKELKAEIAAKEAEAIELRAALQRGQMELLEGRNTNAQLKQQCEEKDTEFRNLRTQMVELQNLAQQAQQKAAAAEARAASAERAAAKLAHSMRRDKRLNEAATVIQRAFRAYRVRALQFQRSQGFAALSEAQLALGSLTQQHSELEARRHSNLALTGQTLVTESLGCLQDLVETLVAEFLLPSKDLKAVQRLRAMAPDAGGNRGRGGVPASREYLQSQQQQQQQSGTDLIGAFRVQDRASRDSSASAPPSAETAQFRKQIGYRL